MSIRYEMPSDDPEEIRRSAEERHAEWKSLASEVTRTDPKFKRWEVRHWSLVWSVAGVVFGLLMVLAIKAHEPGRFPPIAIPFFGALIVYVVGSEIHATRIRKIGVEVWSRKREEELKKVKKSPTLE